MHHEKPPTNSEIGKNIINLKEEKDRKTNPSKNLNTDIYQPEVTEEEKRLVKNDPEKQFIPIEEIAEQKLDDDRNNIDIEEYYNEQIDNPRPTYKEYDERKSTNRIPLTPELENIKQKHSLPSSKWDSLTTEKQKEKKQARTTETNELYVREPKKMVPKNKKKSVEKAA